MTNDPHDNVAENPETPPADDGLPASQQETKLTFEPLGTAITQFSKSDKPLNIEQLFKALLNLPTEERLQCINAFLLAKVIAEKTASVFSVEFLKELGRNERAILSAEKLAGKSGSLQDGDTPWAI